MNTSPFDGIINFVASKPEAMLWGVRKVIEGSEDYGTEMADEAFACLLAIDPARYHEALQKV